MKTTLTRLPPFVPFVLTIEVQTQEEQDKLYQALASIPQGPKEILYDAFQEVRSKDSHKNYYDTEVKNWPGAGG